MRVALTGLTMAEYFRDQQHQDVLLFIDNIFRYVQAGSEVSALMGRMPLRRGLSAHPGQRDGRASRSGSPPPGQGHHLCAGGIRPGGRPHRPRPRHHLPPIWTPPPCCPGRSWSRASIRRWTRWSPPPAFWSLTWWESATIRWPGRCRSCSSGTGSFRTSLPSLGMEGAQQGGTRLPWSGPAASSSSSPSPSRWPQTFTGLEGRFVKLEDTLRSFGGHFGRRAGPSARGRLQHDRRCGRGAEEGPGYGGAVRWRRESASTWRW